MMVANRPTAQRNRSGLRGLSGSGQPAGTLASDAAFQAAVASAQSNGYSTPYNAVYAGTGSAMMVANADNTYSYIYDWINYPPTNIWPGAAAGVAQSFVLPPKSVWQAAVVSLGLASLAQLQAANTTAAVATAQTSCNSTGGTWNPATSSCAVAPGTPAPTYTPPPSGNPSVSFLAWRGQTPVDASALQWNDTFRITITNAAPNQVVSAYRSDGASATLGTTNASGNYMYGGTITSGYPLGTFIETIKVGGVNIGQYGFTVSAPSIVSAPSTAVSAPAPVYTPPAYTPPTYTPPPSPSYSPRLSFTTSRGGSQLQNGDTWQVRITGAPPNSAVSVYGVHPDGTTATNAMGQTDGQGNFSLQGTIDASSAGAWQETWYVGSQAAGSFSFSVAPPVSSGVFMPAPIFPGGGITATNPSGGSVPSGGAAPSGGGTPSASSPGACDSGSLSIGSYCVPLWGLGLGALVLVMAMGKR